MTLEDLHSFVTTYRVESLSEAARQLNCTQGAVAQHVRKLERELGTELFVRVPRGVTPTEAGKILYAGASSALGTLDMAVKEIDRSLQQKQERLSISASSMAASGFLRSSILAIKKRHPNAVIEIEVENTAEDRLRALQEGRANLAIIPLTDPTPGFEIRPMMEVELLLLVHRNHPFAKRKKLRISELSSINYIAQSTSSATFHHIARSFQNIGIKLQPSQIVEQAEAAILMVELGQGETFISSKQAAEIERAGNAKAVVVTSLPPMQTGWVARNFSLLPAIAIEFLNEFDLSGKKTRDTHK